MNDEIKNKKELIVQCFDDCGIHADVVGYDIAPSFERYYIDFGVDQPVTGIRIRKGLDNIAFHLGEQAIYMPCVRGNEYPAIDIPLIKKNEFLYEEAAKSLNPDNPLEVCIGKLPGGEYLNIDIKKAPHIVIGGTTGSGKSILLHSIFANLIEKNEPDLLKFVLVDPKRIEFSYYRNSPYLFMPIVRNYEDIGAAFTSLADEMERRYARLMETECITIVEYNILMETKMPTIIVAIDEYAEIVDTGVDDTALIRLLQKGRAVGIHVIIATQRPTHNVLSGRLLMNVGTVVALRTSNGLDSKNLLGEYGAEKLQGRGDGLVKYGWSPMCNQHIQAPFISNVEIKTILSKKES